MRAVERSAERDAALVAMLPHVGEHGWSARAVAAGLRDLGLDPAGAAFVFNDTGDMIEAYGDWADRRMGAGADASASRVSGRVRALVAARLIQAEPERAAVRRAVGWLMLPANAGVAARMLARSVDAIWHEAGDRSADFGWYSKRAILAGVYLATLLFWLRQDPYSDPDQALSLAFLDRRLADVGRLGRWRGRLSRRAAVQAG